jgi:putative Holliday junction resolvase
MSRLLGIDFGSVRIGIAISDELGLLAHPLETILAKQDVLRRIAQIVNERKIETVVVGVPRKMSGEIGRAAIEATQFAEKLRGILPCKVDVWDERLTTVAANRALREAGRKTRETRSYVDRVAAQMILQGYLDRESAKAESSPDNVPD